jgi:phosphoglycolate phosphatase
MRIAGTHPRPRRDVRLVVFDWDGTLMDSAAQIVACMHAATRDLGMARLEDTAVRNIIGLGLNEAIEVLFPGHVPGFHAALTDRYRQHWLNSGTSRLFTGVRETLDTLRDLGVLMAVATGKSRRGLDRVLIETGLTSHFHATRCSDETSSKPDPRMLTEILEELGVEPSGAVMVGDTEYDMEMALRAGVGRIAVAYGVHTRERLMRYKPFACLETIAELQAWLTDAPGIGNRYGGVAPGR